MAREPRRDTWATPDLATPDLATLDLGYTARGTPARTVNGPQARSSCTICGKLLPSMWFYITVFIILLFLFVYLFLVSN
jgi:hypothetical protein